MKTIPRANKQSTSRHTATVLTPSLSHHHPNKNSQNVILCFLL